MVSKVLFRLARHRLFDAVVRFGCAHLSALLPVRRVVETRRVIGFRHPRPSWPRHVLFVPKAAIPSLLDVRREQMGVVRELFRLALDVASRMRLDADGFVVMVNGGAYQDVGQLHVHLVSPAPELWYVCPDEMPRDVVLETDAVTAFRHPRPRRATHVVIAPRGGDGGESSGGGFEDGFVEAAVGVTQELMRSPGLLKGGYTLVVSRPGGSPWVRPCFHVVAGETLGRR